MSSKRARSSKAKSAACHANDPANMGDKATSTSIDTCAIYEGVFSDILIGDNTGMMIGTNIVIDDSDSDNHWDKPSSSSNNKGTNNDTVSQAKKAKAKPKPKPRASRSKASLRRVDRDFNNHRSAIWQAFMDGNEDCDDESDAGAYYDACLAFKNLNK